MYYDFFGFREPPFSIAPDPRYLYLSDRHKEALAHLMYGVQGQGSGGFIVITGEVGTGKTTVSRCFIENAPENVDIALILNPRLSARELLSAVCDELEIAHAAEASIKQMVDLINRDLLNAHARGRHKVLMIDEAQNLSADVLEQLRLLTNLETAEKKLLQIVLLGQPELQQVLALPELRQLNQRVTARYHLDAIAADDLPGYLRYRVSVAGIRGDLFTAGAIKRLYRESQGIPRLINLISDRALLGAYAEGDHEIQRAHIRQAAREVKGPLRLRRPIRSNPLAWGALALVAVLAVAGLLARDLFAPADSAPSANTASSDESPPLAPSPEAEADDVRIGQVQRAADGEEPPDLHTLLLDDTQAFSALFGAWGKRLETGGTAPCDQAEQEGLACLDRQGTLRSLMFLDRPALLRLRLDDGRQGAVVVTGLDSGQATLSQPDGQRLTVPVDALEASWFGDYTVLWQRPELPTGDGSGEPLWLDARMMTLADRLAPSEAERDRLIRLPTEDQVKWYQSLRGLTVDGIAGGMTIIQMNNDLDAAVPRLSRAQPAAAGEDLARQGTN
ncbi:ExeA family protein [Marinobacter sp. C2H3]|uniref:ExeA family protein n=1 Tax=Marinobacter sp. C2H3 TaxID=3119003 RepID=UPI00300F3D5A